MDILFGNLGQVAQDLVLLVNRLLLGLFFILARFRWVYDPAGPAYVSNADNYRQVESGRWFSIKRHESLKHKLVYCGLDHVSFWAPFVAIVELAAALGILVGLLTPLAAFGLLAILVRATFCTAHEKTMKQNPIDRIDVVSCYLWTPEPVYIGLTLVALVFGAGAYGLDAVVLQWLSR